MGEELVNKISSRFTGVEAVQGNDFTEISVPSADLLQVCEFLKNEADFSMDYLFNMTAVDWQEYFTTVYHIESTTTGNNLVLKCRIDDHETPAIDSVSKIWPAADVNEREVYDLFGIRFNGHPDLRRIFLEDDWEGHPLRKDYKDEINIIER